MLLLLALHRTISTLLIWTRGQRALGSQIDEDMAIRNVQYLYKGPSISNSKYSDFAPSHCCVVGMLAGLESMIDSHTHQL
jgi:hypothetical protein